MSDAPLWRTVHDMIRQYGSEAEAQARFRADKLREHGMVEDAEEWRRVADAIAELGRKKPGDGEPIN